MFFACAVVFFILILLYKALVFSFLWEWFIVSTFGLVGISIVSAVGIILIADLLLKKAYYNKKIFKELDDDWNKLIKSFFYELLNYTLPLIFGYIFYYSFI